MPELFQRNGVYAITPQRVIFHPADLPGFRAAIYLVCCEDESNLLVAEVCDGLIVRSYDREPR